jgi:hypothetical protein
MLVGFSLLEKTQLDLRSKRTEKENQFKIHIVAFNVSCYVSEWVVKLNKFQKLRFTILMHLYKLLKNYAVQDGIVRHCASLKKILKSSHLK